VNDAHEERHILALESANGISIKVTEVALLALLLNVGMLAHKQPAAVSEEEAPFGVVGVSLSLGVLVMHAMVTAPLNDVILWTSQDINDYKL
jgi:hypothetical protein